MPPRGPSANRFWWEGQPEERYWLEITGRSDIGVNLNAPVADKNGRSNWSYDLIHAVNDGDVVYHYDTNCASIVGCSTVLGGPWPDEVIWAARGRASRLAGIQPHSQPGWYRALEGFQRLAKPLSLEELIQDRTKVLSIANELSEGKTRAIHFPFTRYRDSLRAFQGYLVKFPSALLEAFPQLKVRDPRKSGAELGRDSSYRQANEETAVAAQDPFFVDPSHVERSLRSHARTQNLLAAFIEGIGCRPQSPCGGDPSFDLCWEKGAETWVAEVKSLSPSNEERQLRLGLGQVLRYRDIIGRQTGKPTRAALVIERAPADLTWANVCSSVGVVLAWGPSFSQLIG